MAFYHAPVLLQPALDGLALQPHGVYVDATYGGGGHSRGIASHLLPPGRLLAFDRDADAHAHAAAHPFPPLTTVVHRPFSQLAAALAELGLTSIDGLLADLGISSHQIDEPSRGFAHRHDDAPLDMRMDVRQPTTAADLLNTAPETELARILAVYGELPRPRALAAAIGRARAHQPLQTTAQLKQALQGFIPRSKPAAWLSQLYQALRIAVNDELAELEALLSQAAQVMRPGGRLVVISYHSLEDRLVKHHLRAGNAQDELAKDAFGHSRPPWHALTRKPLLPTDAEVAENPRARSARLRIAERTHHPAPTLA